MVNCLGLLALAWTLTATPTCPRAPAVTLQAPTSAGGGYPEWPEAATTGRRELSMVLESFTHVVTAVPVEAASEAGCQWEAFLDGGFEAHRFIHKSISRESYPEVLGCLHIVLLHCREAYPDLWAVLKFVPKKNGLSPVLALLAREGADAVSVATLSPRVLRRRLDDLQRAFEQSWALISCYLTQPQGVREDLLWAARTVTERVKTDQRSRALEVLCLGIFGRGAALFPLLVGGDASEAMGGAAGAAAGAAAGGAAGVEAVAKLRWLRRLEGVRRVGAVHQFGAAAAPPVSASEACAWPGACTGRAAERRGVGSGQCADGSVPWLRESFGRAYSADDQQSVAALGKRGWERSGLSCSNPTPTPAPALP